MIAVLTVCPHILQFPIGKQVKAHFFDILLPQFRQDMRDIIGEHTVGRQDQYIGRIQIPAIPIQKIGNPMQRHGGLSTSRRTLNHQNLILCIADNGILFLLDGAHNVL